VEGIRKSGHRDVELVNSADELTEDLKSNVRDGDLVVFLGAGTIDALARKFGREENSK